MNDLQITKHGILLEKTDAGFEEAGVLNPGTTKGLEGYHLLYRAVGKGNRSSIGYCKLSDPLNISHREKAPVMVPEMYYEEQGMEDPRLVKIEDLFYVTYTGFDGVNALGALATSADLKTFERKGVIVPEINYIEFNALTASITGVNEKYKRYNDSGNVVEKLGKKLLLWDKNVILFPRKINDQFYFLHRIKPDIQIVAINELLNDHEIIIKLLRTDISDIAKKTKDAGTADFLTKLLEVHETQAWVLRRYLS